MKETFSGYYLPVPTEEELAALWNECVFVPDANVLLGLYRMLPRSAEEWLEIFAELADRGQLWIPHQVALEYHRERPDVIARETAELNKKYDHIQQLLNDALGELKKLHRDKRSPFEVDEEGPPLIETMEATVSETREALKSAKQEPLDLLDDDPIRQKITTVFDDRLGAEYARAKLEEIYQDAARRYDLGIRPGFRDARKGGVTQYGDVVLWFQLIDYAKEVRKSIVFITHETKDDWWLKASRAGEIINAHPELIEEIKRKAGVLFYMYEPDTFIDGARRYLDVSVSQEVIEEARDMKRLRELEEMPEHTINLFATRVAIRRKVREIVLSYGGGWAGSSMAGFDMFFDLAKQHNLISDDLAQDIKEFEFLSELGMYGHAIGDEHYRDATQLAAKILRQLDEVQVRSGR